MPGQWANLLSDQFERQRGGASGFRKYVREASFRHSYETYRRLGVDAEFKPLNDVVVGGRKISGNGAGMHESASILVGNIILNLNYDLIARVLRVPDEKFRDKWRNVKEKVEKRVS